MCHITLSILHMLYNANFKGIKYSLGEGVNSTKSIYSHEEEIHERSNGRNPSYTGRSLSGTVNNFGKKMGRFRLNHPKYQEPLLITQGPTNVSTGSKNKLFMYKHGNLFFAWSYP